MQLVLVLQVYALWGQSMRALVFLLVCLAAEGGVLFSLTVHHPAIVTKQALPISLQGCLASIAGNTPESTQFGLLNCIIVISFHSVILLATLWRTWVYRRSKVKAPIVGLMLYSSALPIMPPPKLIFFWQACSRMGTQC